MMQKFHLRAALTQHTPLTKLVFHQIWTSLLSLVLFGSFVHFAGISTYASGFTTLICVILFSLFLFQTDHSSTYPEDDMRQASLVNIALIFAFLSAAFRLGQLIFVAQWPNFDQVITFLALFGAWLGLKYLYEEAMVFHYSHLVSELGTPISSADQAFRFQKVFLGIAVITIIELSRAHT